MKLQKNTLLALYSVIEFASRPGEHVSAGEVAAKHGESAHHLAKVLSSLVRAGFVESVRGVGGGYRFVGNPRRLTMLDVIQLFEPVAAEREGGAVNAVDSVLAQVLDEIDQTAVATFGSITISTLLQMVQGAAAPAASAVRPHA
ncbi:MAG: Rrf2 family transcriptional regulator [Burkholderiales bacterium]|nr:Rrf2 family transcriptional regulator [Burkholderiales bacterium]